MLPQCETQTCRPQMHQRSAVLVLGLEGSHAKFETAAGASALNAALFFPPGKQVQDLPPISPKRSVGRNPLLMDPGTCLLLSFSNLFPLALPCHDRLRRSSGLCLRFVFLAERSLVSSLSLLFFLPSLFSMFSLFSLLVLFSVLRFSFFLFSSFFW